MRASIRRYGTGAAAVLVAAFGVPAHAWAQHEVDSLSWYLPVDDGCELYVTESGLGDSVVVLHGGFGAEHSYLHDPLSAIERDRHLIYYDQRGSLRSPCPDSLISVDAHLEDLERLRRELGLERMTLLGHSMGSYLAMAYLERHPKHVGRMVLVGAIVPRTPTSREEAELYRREQVATKAFIERPEVAAEIAEEGLDGDSLSARQETFAWRVRFAGANIFHVNRWRQMRGGRVFYSQPAGSAAGRSMPESWDFVNDLAEHPYPVTVILGDHDIVGGGELHSRMLRPLENVRLIVLENAGHNSWIDRPDAFERHLRRALLQAASAPEP